MTGYKNATSCRAWHDFPFWRGTNDRCRGVRYSESLLCTRPSQKADESERVQRA